MQKIRRHLRGDLAGGMIDGVAVSADGAKASKHKAGDRCGQPVGLGQCVLEGLRAGAAGERRRQGSRAPIEVDRHRKGW